MRPKCERTRPKELPTPMRTTVARRAATREAAGEEEEEGPSHCVRRVSVIRWIDRLVNLPH